MMYANYEYYKEVHGGTLGEEDANKALAKASRHIDTLTFNRIVGLGFDNLESFQQGVVRDVCCMMADFEKENDSMINNMLSSYSLNGASLAFSGDSTNATIVNGICIQKDTYQFLSQTGLCSRSLRGC